MSYYDQMIRIGFRHASVLELGSDLLVSQVANEDSVPVVGHRNRNNGSFAWAKLIAPSVEARDFAVAGGLA